MNRTTLRLETELPDGLPRMEHSHRLLTLGSCFAEEVGRCFAESGFRTDINPFGTLYNPASLFTALGELRRREEGFDRSCLTQHDGLWMSFLHGTAFSASTPEEALNRINRRFRAARAQLLCGDWLLLTFGSATVYRLADEGTIVANCHKLPARMFRRERLSADAFEETGTAELTQTLSLNPRLRVLVTVSPVRYVADGLHANQRSKGILLDLADRLCERFPERVFYFPAYEIVMDELRDYRFYTDDMVHPSPLAVRYVWEQLKKCLFSPAARTAASEIEALRRDLAHRPFHPESAAHKQFLEKTVLKIEQLKRKYPYFAPE